MVLESVVADLLNRFLGDYVENLNKSQLKLGIWGGKEPLPSAAPCPLGLRSLRGQGAGLAGGGCPVRGSRAVELPTPLRVGGAFAAPCEQWRVPGPRPSLTDPRCVAAHVPAPLEHRRSLCARGLRHPLPRLGVWGGGMGARRWPRSASSAETADIDKAPVFSPVPSLGCWVEARWCCWSCGRAHGAVPRVAGALGAGAADGVLGAVYFSYRCK